ncbi:MAG: hypothetical protein MJ240_13545 [Kiritimatiellae bacterium]|nr:hypothetical protein [Kiritimatiellia bacterium]
MSGIIRCLLVSAVVAYGLSASAGMPLGLRLAMWNGGDEVQSGPVEPIDPVEPTPVEPVEPTPVDPISPVVETPKLYSDDVKIIAEEVAAPYALATTVYDGYVVQNGVVMGTLQVKVAKGKVDRKSGLFSAKVTATVQMADGSRKLSFKNGLADAAGNVVGLTAAGHSLDITLGVDGLGGTFDGMTIDGARNVFSAKDQETKDRVAAVEKQWVGAVNVVGDGVALAVSIARKGKVKVSGTVNGAKVTTTSQLLVGEGACCVPVVITKKANLVFNLWLMDDGSIEIAGLEGVVAGKAGTLKAGAVLCLSDGGAAISRALPGLLGDYLPGGLSVSQSGAKWVVAGGAKAGKVAIDKKTGEIDEAKLGANPSGLKLTYTAKTGAFKGSFKAYALEKGKIKAYTMNIEGVMVGNTGYGTATIKNPPVCIPVTIE